MFHVPEEHRTTQGLMPTTAEDGNNGLFMVPFAHTGKTAAVIASDGMGWEHVSVSYPNRCPTWEEMCIIKNLFWDDEDVVVEYHPRKSEYVNNHDYTLHLWLPTEGEIPTPPSILVGF